MQLITAYGGRLHVQACAAVLPDVTGEAEDRQAWPGTLFSRSTVHELLFDGGVGHSPPMGLAAALVHQEWDQGEPAVAAREVVWMDPQPTVYPPALIAAGLPADRLHLLRPRWADVAQVAVECLRCEGVAAVVTPLPARLSRVEARRLRLAAERGNSLGIFLREARGGVAPDIHAASSRWLVSPAPGERTVQRWRLQLLHGHGRILGQSFILEKGRASSRILCRQADPVRPPAPLARPVAVATARSA